MADLKEDETLDSGAAGRVARSFQNVQMVSVADPEREKSEWAFTENTQVKVATKAGLLYTVHFGKAHSLFSRSGSATETICTF